jgi:hypothetical protein
MNQHAVVSKFPTSVSPAEFKTDDMPPATDKVSPVMPWK